MQSKKDVNILIVDDEESIRITFQMFLERDGYGRVTTAATIEEALVFINEEPFDLIISDIVLEGATGTDLLRLIRQTGLFCPVVMVTGFPNLDSAAEAIRHGAFDYISKPVNKETLLRFVRQALNHWVLAKEKQRLQQENEKYRRYLEVIFSSVRDAIITVNEKLEVTHLNNTGQLWFGYSKGKTLNSLADLPGDFGQACLLDAHKVLEDGETVREHTIECCKPDGSIRLISLNAAPIEDSTKEEFKGAVIVARDITLTLPDTSHVRRSGFHNFIGISDTMQDVYHLIENVGRVDTTVLVTGESGTGKELAAEALHNESRRKNNPLVKVDCGSIPEELLESELFGHKKGAFTGAENERAGRLLQGHTGTVFLDEIGEISPRMQLRLLRFLQEKTFNPVGQDESVSVDVRIIAATNVDLRRKVSKGDFREDLYYRLKVVEIELPPLRERSECVPLLVHHFMLKFGEEINKKIVNISDQAMELLKKHRWPGNVRELRHVIERACVLCKGSTLSKEHFSLDKHQEITKIENVGSHGLSYEDKSVAPTVQTPSSQIPSLVFQSEKDRIQQALAATGGNKAKAAKLLGINRTTLYRKLKRYNYS